MKTIPHDQPGVFWQAGKLTTADIGRKIRIIAGRRYDCVAIEGPLHALGAEEHEQIALNIADATVVVHPRKKIIIW